VRNINRLNQETGYFMYKNEKINNNILRQDNLGFLLWQLEEIENFYPCFKTMIKKEE